MTWDMKAQETIFGPDNYYGPNVKGVVVCTSLSVSLYLARMPLIAKKKFNLGFCDHLSTTGKVLRSLGQSHSMCRENNDGVVGDKEKH